MSASHLDPEPPIGSVVSSGCCQWRRTGTEWVHDYNDDWVNWDELAVGPYVPILIPKGTGL